MAEPIGNVFPAGGPVPPELVIGRRREIADIVGMIREHVSVLIYGPRRIGKTTLCDAACAEAASSFNALVVRVEVPERQDGWSFDLLQMIQNACATVSPAERQLLKATRPLLEEILKEHGLPLDLGKLGQEPDPGTVRKVLALPAELARRSGRTTIFFLDELQRVASYQDGRTFVLDLVDLYTNRRADAPVTVLVDGSDERALELLSREYNLDKLCRRYEPGETISKTDWRPGLRDHFQRAGLQIAEDALEALVDFGDERPYPTMLAAQHSGMNARELESDEVDLTAVSYAIEQTRREIAG